MHIEQKGFTLIELMIVIAILGIIASVAMPAYMNYVKKAQFTEVVLAATTVKTSIETAAYTGKLSSPGKYIDLDKADGGINSINADITTATGVVASVKTINGVITSKATDTIYGEDFILTPKLVGTKLEWTRSGSCAAASHC